MSTLAALPHGAPRVSPVPLAGVVLVHAVLLAVLLNAPAAPVAVALARPVTVTVSLIESEVETPQPDSRPPPRPAVASRPPPVLAAERPLPTPAPQPVVEMPDPQPEPATEALQPAQANPAAEAAPSPAPPLTPPRPADYRTNPKPSYPPLSRRLGEAGTVRLNILVNPDGSVARLELVQSSGYPRLDQSAIETVQSSWKFEPARQDGQPVSAWVIVPIQFTLRS
jgi:periplasmic protein TonB